MDYHVWRATLEKFQKPHQKPKTIRYLKIALELVLEDLHLEPINKALQRDSEHVWDILAVNKLNTYCNALLNLFEMWL